MDNSGTVHPYMGRTARWAQRFDDWGSQQQDLPDGVPKSLFRPDRMLSGRGVVPQFTNGQLRITRGAIRTRVWHGGNKFRGMMLQQDARYRAIGTFAKNVGMFAMFVILADTLADIVRLSADINPSDPTKDGRNPTSSCTLSIPCHDYLIDMVPKRTSLYVAGALLTVGLIMDAFCQQLGSSFLTNSASAQVVAMYTEMRTLYLRVRKSDMIPPLEPYTSDNLHLTELAAGVVTVGIGNWLMSKDVITAGLVMILIGALLMRDGMLGRLRTYESVMFACIDVVGALYDFVSDAGTDEHGERLLEGSDVLHQFKVLKLNLNYKVEGDFAQEAAGVGADGGATDV